MTVPAIPRETGVLNLVADFCNNKPKDVYKVIHDLAKWVITISDCAEVTLVDRNVLDLGELTKGLKSIEGVFDFAALVPGIRDLTNQVAKNDGVRAVSRAAASALASISKCVLWLDRVDVIKFGPSIALGLTITKCLAAIYAMGNNSIDNVSELWKACSLDDIAAKKKIYKKQICDLIRNVAIVALSFFALMAELAICSPVPIVMLICSTVSLFASIVGFVIKPDTDDVIQAGQLA